MLLHGFPENGASWRHQVSPLVDAGFSVHVPDLRGYGRSDKPPGRTAYRLSNLADDVAAIANSTGHPRIRLVGHDWGGIIAWEFASRSPERIDRLVILNAPHLRLYVRKAWLPPQLFKSWYVLFFQLPGLPERLLAAGDFRLIREMFRRTPARQGTFSEEEIDGFVEAMRQPGALTAALNYYRANLLSRGAKGQEEEIKAPTLVIWGERDPALSTTLLDGITRVAPNTTLLRLPNVGHWVQNEAPEEVSRAILEFFGA